MKIKVGDKVEVIAGASKGKTGKVLRTYKNENKVVVEGCNIVKKHQRPSATSTGGIVEVEAKIDASNVMIVDPKTNKPTRIGHTIDKNDKKVRIAKKSGEKID